LTDILNKFREEVLRSVVKGNKIEIKKDPILSVANSEEEENDGNSLLRFVHAVPKFVGSDLNVYGPFEEEDMANVPSDVAMVLVEKKRAEKVSL